MMEGFKPFVDAGELTPELVERMRLAGFELKTNTGYFATFATSVTYGVSRQRVEQSLHLEITLDFDDKSMDALLGIGDSGGPIHAEVLRFEELGILLWLNELGKGNRDTSAMSDAQKKLYKVILDHSVCYAALVQRVMNLPKWLTVSLEPKTETVH